MLAVLGVTSPLLTHTQRAVVVALGLSEAITVELQVVVMAGQERLPQ
jgi:hypothetical protein